MRLMKKKKSPAMAIWFMVAWPKGNILGAETAAVLFHTVWSGLIGRTVA